MFSYRTRMANYSENYKGLGGPSLCSLCQNHIDKQELSYQCPLVRENIKIIGNYSNIFAMNVDIEVVKTVWNISKFREEYLNSRKIN